MAKQLNVNLAFTADTGKAKQQMDDLSASLNRLMANAGKSAGDLGLTQELAAATNEVAKLQSMLDASKNAFGGLDLGKFNQSLKQNGIQITDYAKTLSSLGPAGDQAFTKLASSIVQAEVPLRRTSGLLSEFKTTLMNTARWQISSSILHGFMGALQGAYGYAQDLNESLNNIRIVTGANADEMARFAKEANKAAKALSTTTTEYTNASLIYFQQGLNEEEVKKRADITIKMANVSRQSAEEVSEQLTAVWNNFYDGTKALEYYADVMTALGAATASSSEEIADGLNKFAAVAETVGLSYEYAAAALATVTATTRQSADIVGTAFKTLFARLNDLKLGETLDDGTTLGTYTENLAKVGVQIKDANGDLKDMDTILSETAEQWKSLDKDQQVALAKGVAGLRQYTQFIALMDNWDFMEENLATANNSIGELSNQADIYAESWEAAQDRVTAALEEIYNQLLDDDFFIGITDGFAGFLNVVSNTIDSLGGLSGVLTVASSIMFKMFGKDMATMIDNWAYNLKNKTQGAKQDILKMRQDMIQSVKTLYADSANDGPVTGASATAFGEQAFLADALLQKQQELVKKGQQLSEADRQQVQYLLQINEALGNQAIQAAKNLEIAEHHGDEIENQLKKLAKNNNASGGKKINYGADIAPQVAEAKKLQKEFSSLEAVYNKLQAAYGKQPDIDAGPLIQDLQAIRDAAENANLDVDQFDRALKALQGSSNVGEALGSIETEMYEIGAEADQAAQRIRTAFDGSEIDLKQVDAILDQLYDSWVQQGIITVDVAQKLKSVGAQAKDAGEKIKGMDGPPPSVGQKIVAVGNLLSNVAMSVSSIKGLFDTWNNEDMSFGDKLISTFTTLGMIIPMVTSSLMGNNLAMLGSASASIATALGFDGVAISAKVAAGGVGALWAALWPIALIAAGVAAAIAAVVAIVKVASDAYNADAIAAEKAAKAAEDLAKSHEEAKQTLEDLQSAFSKYDEAITALEACTEGTEEWNTALQKVNKTVLELIDEYPNLLKNADVFTRNEITGMLELNRKKQQEILDELEKYVSVTQAASLFGAANASKAQAKSNKTDITRSIGSTEIIDLISYSKNGAVKSYADDSDREILNAGKILTDNALELANLTETEYRKKITDLLSNATADQTKLFNGYDLQINELIDKCIEYQDEIDQLAINTEAAANQMANVAQLIADQNLGDKFDTAEKTIAGKVLAERENELYDQYYKKMTGRGINKASGADNAIYKDMAEKLAAATGNKFAALTKGNAVTGTDGNRKLVFYNNETGKRESYDAEWVAQQIAAAEALKELSGSAKEAQNTLSTMDDQIKNISSGSAAESQSNIIRSFIANSNFDSGNKKDFSALATEVAEQGGAEAYIKAVFGQNGEFTDAMAKKYGYETAAEFIDTFNTKLTDMESAWDTIELPADLLGTEEVSFETAKKISNVFKQINLGPAGQAAGETFTKGINQMLKNLSESDQQAALEQLIAIDWSSWDALEQADDLMKQFGVDIDTSTQEWIDFAAEMRKATGAIPDYSKLREDLASLNAIIDDLDFGSIIDDEDYNRLVSYNDEWERFFILQTDGSRMFIGDSTTMRKALQETQKAMIEDMAVKQGFLDVNWGYKDAQGEWQTTDWSTVTGGNIGAARNLMNAGGATEKYLKSQGYDDKTIEKFIRDYEGEDPSKQTAAKEALQKMFDTIAKMQDSNITQELEDMRSMYASTAVSYQELNTMLRKGDLGTKTKSKNDVYKKQLESIARTSFNDATTLTELDEAWKKAKSAGAVNSTLTSITDVDYSENLIRLAENSDIAAEALTNYQKVLGSGGSTELAAQDALKYALVLDETAKKYDLNAEELQNFTIDLSESMNLTSQEALNMATGYMKMAEEFGISAEELIKHITALNALSFDPNTMTDALRELNTTAQECGISFEELVSICTDLSEEFNLTGDSGHDAIAMATTFAKANKDLGVSTEELKIQTKELQEQYGLTAKAASDLTVRNQRMNKGVQALYDNWESWSQELKKSDKTTVNYAKAAAGAQEAIRDLLGLSDDFDFADNFLEADATLTALEQAANGSEEAITKLGLAVSKSWVQSLEQVNTELDLLDEEGEVESKWTMMAEQFDIAKTTIINGIIQMQENLSSLNVGDPVQSMGEEWIAAMNNMAIATGMSVDEMQSMLSSMGVSAKVETKYVEQKVQVPEYTTTEEVTAHKIDENVTAYTKTSSTTQTGVKEMDGMVPVAAIASDGDPETPEVIYTGAGKASPNTKKGGGPAATPKAPKFKEQRHVEKDDQIDDIDEEIKDLERALDNASGEDKVSLMRQIQDAKDRKAQLISGKLADDINIGEYLDRDEEALKTATGNLSQYGVADLQVDENHNITNYEAIWNQIRTKEKELLDAWNNDTSEVNENALNEFYDFVSQFEEAYDRFVDTREEAEDFANEIEDLKPKLHEPPDLDEVEDLKLDEYEHAFDDITTSIEAMERATERASKEADNLYGAKRAQALGRVNSSIQQEIGLLNKKIEIAKKVAKFQQDQLKMSLLTAQASLGAQLQFEFAADGSITNLSAVMGELIKKYNELVETYKNNINAFQATGEGIEDWEKEQLDQMEAAIKQQSDFISTVNDQASRYNETLATISESMDSIADKQDEIKSNNYEILSTKLSYALDMTNAELQRIDYQLNKVADDIYKMGEAAGILSQKVGVGQDALAAYTTHMNDLNSAYQQGYIHESDYVAGLQEVRDGMYSELGALQELDKEMMNYYGETLSAAGEEIGKYTDRMDSLNSVLDHYQSLMTLIGKETDYKAMGIVLQGAADTAKNSLAVAQATAEFYAKQAAEKKLLMENAIEGSKAFELYKKEWEAAEAASREAKENMLAKTQEWAEREKAVIENNFKDFKKSLEEALTGGSTFDYLSTQMERSVSLQEEYLTATNQIYETTKMINTAQKAIDQTTNTAAKRELQSFIQKTEQLKNQNKLSKYELDLHQAQYQILQAQIALEEAQNAKSTVRLRRDSEGNFGYVYTADTSKIADAEQKLADAQNAYYNKSLEGANKYTQSYIETFRNMQDEITALTDAWMQGEIQSEEEYNRRKEEIVQFYGEKSKQYSHLYQVAISADSRAIADAWSTDYADMITDTKDWQEKVDDYANKCIGSMQRWQGVVTTVQLTTGASYDEITEKVHSVVTESEALVTAITDPADGVIQAMQKQLEAVSGVTAKYAAQGRELDALISKVEEYILSIDAMIAKVGQANNITLTDPSTATAGGGGGSNGYGNTTNNNGNNNSNSQNTSNSTETDSNVTSYQTGKLSWYDDLQKGRIWTDSAGNTYSEDSVIGQKIQAAFDRAWKAAGKEYKGAWYLGWNELNADELHKKYGLSTGGYTGDWAGPMGKLAFLHQKEIVLNKDDTANLLAAVDMLRTILHTLDVHSMSAQLGGILSTPGFHMGDSGTLEQNVKIEASFPNVQDHNEIEEAFNNLINKASQYANRK